MIRPVLLVQPWRWQWHSVGKQGVAPDQSHYVRHRPCTRAQQHQGPSSPNPAPTQQPSWMNNPAIAQRELLRQYYLVTEAEEMLGIVSSDDSARVLDLNTTLHLLCHTADVRLKGQLTGDVDPLLHTLHSALADSVPTMSPVQLGSMLWGMSTLSSPTQLTDGVVARVAAQELASGRLGSYNTKELCSIIDAYGRLARHRSPDDRAYVGALAGELVRRMQELPYVKSSLNAADCADLAAAIAAMYRQPQAGSSSGAEGPDAVLVVADVPSPALELLDELAQNVRHQMANKHSLRSPFTPRELVRFVGSFAVLGHRSDKVAGMLDAVAGFVVRRVRARHLNAVSRPEDMAGLLRAYATLSHNSVAVPELLTAVGEQVCRSAAQQQERHGVGLEMPSLDEGSSTTDSSRAAANGSQAAAASATAASSARAGDVALPLHYINDILADHLALGYAPSGIMLQALMPVLRRELPSAPVLEVVHLLQLMVHLQFNPGSVMFGVFESCVAASPGEGSAEEAEAAQAGRALLAELQQQCGSGGSSGAPLM